MKGKVESFTPKEWTNPEGVLKHFWELKIEGDPVRKSCWEAEFGSVSIGQEIDYTVTKTDSKGNERISIKGGKPFAGGGGSRTSPEALKQQLITMSMAYAKDMTIAMMENKDMKPSSKITDFNEAIQSWTSLAEHFLTWGKGKL